MVSRLIVVKVGTSGITTADGKLDEEEMRHIAEPHRTYQSTFDSKRKQAGAS